jgi:hypothetical protein
MCWFCAYSGQGNRETLISHDGLAKTNSGVCAPLTGVPSLHVQAGTAASAPRR